MGVNLNLAPCADILTNPNNKVIGDRSFGTNAETVEKFVSAAIRGLQVHNMMSCAKHFPGHGNTLLDSHEALPVEQKTWEELEKFEVEPFKRCFRAKLPLVMTSHIMFPKIDPVWPCTLSETMLTKILREQVRFRGLTITDDLGMKALTLHHTVGQIAVRALKAGANILLFCNEPEAPGIAIEAIEQAITEKQLNLQTLADNAKRVLELKEEYLKECEPMADDELRYVVGNAEHQRLSEAIASGKVPEDLLAQPS
jgi:beta-N-acetylhexosaminidase